MDRSRNVLLRGTANSRLGQAIAGELDISVVDCQIERFPDGEVSVEIESSVRDKQVFVIQPTSPPVNDHLMELVALADACRRAAAARVIAVVPYFRYPPADRRKFWGIPIRGRVRGDLFEPFGGEIPKPRFASPRGKVFFFSRKNFPDPHFLWGGGGIRSPETLFLCPEIWGGGQGKTFSRALGGEIFFFFPKPFFLGTRGGGVAPPKKKFGGPPPPFFF